jgi:hypothetical protein
VKRYRQEVLAEVVLEIYSRLALADAQQRYDQVITRFPV